MLISDHAGLGAIALEEVAAEGRHSTSNMLEPILKLAKATTTPAVGGFRGKMPRLSSKPRPQAGERPWRQAANLARLARQQWGLGTLPVSNKQLADLLGTKPNAFTDQTKGPAAIPLVMRTGENQSFDLYFDSVWSTSRRFAASRLLGDHLHHAIGGRLLPATHAKTSRQQFQRAFAQEFLCPFDALLEKIQTGEPDDEDFAEAAQHFQVSPWVIQTTLVNKGELDRESLTWGD